MGRNQKRNKKAKIQTGSRNSVVGLRSEQCAGGMNSGKQEANFARCCEISQDGAKFRKMLRNFVGCESSQPTKFYRL